MEQIPIICGPTACGKTAIALDLAKDFPIEIISADSRQVLREFEIGTAKPTPEERRRVPFHLVDIINPGERYTAYRFIEDADRAIGEVIAKGNIPLIVGGTGLYLRALIDGVVKIEQADDSVRDALEEAYNQDGGEALYNKLKEVDPDEAALIHPNNRVRLIRALEIFQLTGQPKSKLIKSGDYLKSEFTYAAFCLLPDRKRLYRTIEKRVDRMINAGLPDEVEALLAKYGKNMLHSTNVIGYIELLEYSLDNCTLAEAIEQMKMNTRRYAKRQYTWFRNQLEAEQFDKEDKLKAAVLKHLKRIGR
jgi:tRNA dimethylallyltransferase